MKNRFVVNFNIKKVAYLSLVSIIITLGGIYIATSPSEEMPDTARLPRGGRIKNKFIIRIIMIIGIVFFGFASIFFTSLLIKIILNKLIFKNEEKELLVIDNKGLLINQWNIFSKPTLIEWKHIEDICVFNPKDHLFSNNVEQLKNKIIALKLSQEFYNNSSFLAKIRYKLNKKFSKDYAIHINLNFSKLNANEVLSEINKYRFK